MRTRRLGWTDLQLTEGGLGTWAIGGGHWRFGWGPQDDAEAVAAIRHATDLGINWIDTAAVYGLGHSEELVGQAIRGRRDEVVVATKCSLVWDEEGTISSCLERGSVRRECEASLGRLGIERIDLYQLHWPNDDPHIEEGWEEVGRLIEEGKVRYGGVSNFQVGHLERAQTLHPVASLQPPYSMYRRAIEEEVLPWCKAHQVGVVAYSPMQCGLLTGSFDRDRLAENDWRRGSKEFQDPSYGINLETAEELRRVAERHGRTVAQLAIAWVLRREEVTSAIVGARRPSQIEETAGAAGWDLTDEDLEEIEAILARRLARVEPVPSDY